MSLEADIRAWDGKSADAIANVFERHGSSTGFVTRLIELAGDPELERGATWLLKRGFETGALELRAADRSAFYGLFASVFDWGAALHLMQCMSHAPVPAGRAAMVAQFLDRQLTDRRAIVRAWAYWGYHELALASPRYREEAEMLLRDAAGTERAGSVRVRVRKALESRGLV